MPLICLILQTLLCAFGVDFFLPSFTGIQHTFSTPSSSMQYIIGGYTTGALIIRLILCPFSHRIGIRNTFLLMGSVGLSGQLLCGFALSYPWLIAGRIIHGAGTGALFILSMMLFPRFSSQRVIGYNTGFISFNSGLVIGPLIAAFFLESFQLSWRHLFFLTAGAQALLLPCFLAFPYDSQEEAASPLQSYKNIFSSHPVIYNMLWSTATVVQYLSYISQVPHLVIHILGAPPYILSSILLLSSSCSIAFGLGWNYVLKWLSSSRVFTLAFLLNGILFLFSLYLFSSNNSVSFIHLITFIVLQNLTASLVLPFSLAEATRSMPSEEMSIISLASVLRSFFTALLTTLFAICMSSSPNSIGTIFFITSLLSFIPSLMICLDKKKFPN